MKYTPQSVNEKGRLTHEQAEAAALALNAGFVVGGVEANLYAFVALVKMVRNSTNLGETEMNTPNPIRVDWNKHDLAEAYDLVEGVRRAAAQHPESGIDTSLCAALDAIEAADCEWDGMTKP